MSERLNGSQINIDLIRMDDPLTRGNDIVSNTISRKVTAYLIYQFCSVSDNQYPCRYRMQVPVIINVFDNGSEKTSLSCSAGTSKDNERL